MSYDFLFKIKSCVDFVTHDAPLDLVYYSHFITSAFAIMLGIFVLISNKKNIVNKLFFLITLTFSLWVFIDLITWVSYDSRVYMFFWSFFGILTGLLYLLSVYFFYAFIVNKGINRKKITLFSFLLLPVILFTPTVYNLSSFDEVNCISTEAPLFTNYFHFLGIFSAILILITFIYFYKKNKDLEKQDKIKLVLMFLGIEFFILFFFTATFLDSYLVSLGVTGDYLLGNYGLFAILIFLTSISYLIVRFRAFNIKLLAAQALVWALIILVGAQFLYLNEMPTSSLILTSITLILSAAIGLLVVRSVKKVDHQRELLAEANNNQQSLLHFITHQVKGYMTKTRNIFDAMLAGDYGDLPQKAKEMAHYGFDSETRGVETVQAILKASDLKSGRTEFKKEKTNLSALVAEVIDFRKDIAVGKGIELTFDIEPNIITEVDPIHLKEVFKNIISNAIVYTPKGSVHIVLKRDLSKIRFAVIDTGFGLNEEDKEKLFTEGGKGTDSLAINVDSTGYGLFIAKKIVHQHGGTIGAKSEGRDKGSEFFVLLPDIR